MKLYQRLLDLRDSYRALLWNHKWWRNDGQLTHDALRVLDDLKRFCGADSTSIVVTKAGVIDPLATMYAEGKRAVLLRIQQHLNLTDEQLARLKGVDDE